MLEDCLLQPVGTEIVLLISNKHPSFETYWKGFVSTVYQQSLTHAFEFSNDFYYSCVMQVVSTPYFKRLTSQHYTQSEVQALCTIRGGASMVLAISWLKSVSHTSIELKWYDIFYCCDSIQVWGMVNYNNTIKQQLEKMTDAKCRAHLVACYLHEVSGDATASRSICREYDLLVYKDEHACAHKDYKYANLSTNQIKYNFTLAKNDPGFIKFHDLDARIEFVIPNWTNR